MAKETGPKGKASGAGRPKQGGGTSAGSRTSAARSQGAKNSEKKTTGTAKSTASGDKSKTAPGTGPQAKASDSAASQAAKSQGRTSATRTEETAGTAESQVSAKTAGVETSNQTNRQDTEDMSNGTDDQTANKIADYEQKKSHMNQQRRFEAERIVHQHSAVAAGVGVIPVPAIDIGGLAVVQLRMLAKLADKYDVKYSGNLGRTLVSALLGVLVPVSLKTTTYGFLRAVPVFGPLLGFLTLPGFAWAATYAIGTVFIDAFEQDEDFNTIDLDRAKQKVKEVFDKASEKANDAAGAAASKTA